MIDLDVGDRHDHGIVVREVPVGEFDEVSVSAGDIGEESILHQSVEVALPRRWSHHYRASRARLRGMRRMPVSGAQTRPEASNDPDGDGDDPDGDGDVSRKTVYRNVCTEQDPPYSVAVSPNRQCVAFGSRGGVELYWVSLHIHLLTHVRRC